MPPLGLVYRKAFRLHGAAKQFAVPTLERSATGIIGEGTRRHFVVGSGHFDGFASRQVVECEIDGAAAVVARALRGIRNKDFAFRRSGVPENFRDVPRAIGVVDQQAVAEGLEFLLDAEEGIGSGTLQKGAGLRIDGSAEKVVGGGVANIQVNGRIAKGQFDQFRFSKRASFLRRKLARFENRNWSNWPFAILPFTWIFATPPPTTFSALPSIRRPAPFCSVPLPMPSSASNRNS